MKVEIYQQKKGEAIISQQRARQLVDKVLSVLKKPKKEELSIAFISDQEMRKLNSYWLGRKGTTDVLSFNGEGRLLGEILINFKEAKKEAIRQKIKSAKMIERLIVHGVLSLHGMEHYGKKKKRMEELEEKILGI